MCMKKTVKGVLFDLDGTLINFVINYHTAKKKVQQLVNSSGTGLESSDKMTLYSLLGASKTRLKASAYTTLRRKIFEVMTTYEVDAARRTKLLPGVLVTLQQLKQREMKIGIVTNNGHAATDVVLNRFGLHKLVDLVLTRDDVEEMKPHPGIMISALEKLKLRPEETIVVGDSTADVIAARGASIDPVAITTGPSDSSALMQAHPRQVISRIKDVLDIV